MPWTNYHCHTHHCDGSNSPEDYIKQAIKTGLTAFGFSAHAPINFKTDWCVRDDKFQQYLSDIINTQGNYQQEIEIYQGLEIDYIPGIAGRKKHLAQNIELDYFIGSVHFVDHFQDGISWNIDTSKELFEKGLHVIFQNDFRKVSNRFFDITQQMIEEDKPDIIGHFDKIKMFNENNKYFSEDEKWYRDRVESLLNHIKKSGNFVEVNTRGFYKYNQKELYPSQWIMEKLAKKDIPVILNSDSHKPEEIILGFEYAVEKLKKAEVKKLWAFIGNKWQGFDYNLKGIIL